MTPLGRSAHFEPGGATAGYQTTAHFLRSVERAHPGTVERLAQALMNDTYRSDLFRRCTGKPLAACVAEYEAAQRGTDLGSLNVEGEARGLPFDGALRATAAAARSVCSSSRRSPGGTHT